MSDAQQKWIGIDRCCCLCFVLSSFSLSVFVLIMIQRYFHCWHCAAPPVCAFLFFDIILVLSPHVNRTCSLSLSLLCTLSFTLFCSLSPYTHYLLFHAHTFPFRFHCFLSPSPLSLSPAHFSHNCYPLFFTYLLSLFEARFFAICDHCVCSKQLRPLNR